MFAMIIAMQILQNIEFIVGYIIQRTGRRSTCLYNMQMQIFKVCTYMVLNEHPPELYKKYWIHGLHTALIDGNHLVASYSTIM